MCKEQHQKHQTHQPIHQQQEQERHQEGSQANVSMYEQPPTSPIGRQGAMSKAAAHRRPSILSSTSSTVTSQSSPQPTSSHLPLHRQQPAEPVNPYHVLQIRRDATPSEIRQSYRRLALFHHIGRGGLSDSERQRRWQVFVVVAACYETLIEKEFRSRLDLLLKEKEEGSLNDGLPKGVMFVGGEKVFEHASRVGRRSSMNMNLSAMLNMNQNRGSAYMCNEDSLFTKDYSNRTTKTNTMHNGNSDNNDNDDDHHADMRAHLDYSTSRPPALASVSSHSFSDSDSEDETIKLEDKGCDRSVSFNMFSCGSHDDQPDHLGSLVVPSTSSDSTDGPEEHFTEHETNRLFGGPLSLMMQARKWQPFTDPFVVFQQVFGSHIFPVPPRDQLPIFTWLPIERAANHAWNGTSHKDADGATVFVTSRILNGRKLVKTEKVYKDPLGNQRSIVSVTSEDLESSDSMDDARNCNPCLMCPSEREPDGERDTIRDNLADSPQRSCPKKQDESESMLCGNLSYLYDTIHGECPAPANKDNDANKDFYLYQTWNSLWNVQLFPE